MVGIDPGLPMGCDFEGDFLWEWWVLWGEREEGFSSGAKSGEERERYCGKEAP